MINAAIIDDEFNNILNLESLLSIYCPQINIIIKENNVDLAIEKLKSLDINILFLDIQMPNKNGFELLECLNNYKFEIIFVTAHENFALRAIKYSALDYILKPINIVDLQKAVEKAENKIYNNSSSQILHLMQWYKNQESDFKTIALPLENEIRYVTLSDIIKCESENSYTFFYLNDGSKLIVSKGLYEFDNILPKEIFLRCHQSFLVNKKYVKSLVRDNTMVYLKMKDGTITPVARSKKDFIKKSLSLTF